MCDWSDFAPWGSGVCDVSVNLGVDAVCVRNDDSDCRGFGRGTEILSPLRTNVQQTFYKQTHNLSHRQTNRHNSHGFILTHTHVHARTHTQNAPLITLKLYGNLVVLGLWLCMCVWLRVSYITSRTDPLRPWIRRQTKNSIEA